MARRRQQNKGGCDLTPRQRTWLLTGTDWAFLDTDAGPHGLGGFPHERSARLAWVACRDELMAFWLEEPTTWTGKNGFETPAPGGPGTRPWAWWRFEAKVPRVAVRLDPAKKNELRALGWFSEKAWRDFFGRSAADYAETESEASYLLRHGLFLAGEEAATEGPPGPALVE